MLQALIGPVTGLLDKFIEDKDQKNAIAHEIATLATKQAHDAQMGQIEFLKAEAAHRSSFVAGCRPFLGWWLAFAMIWHFVLAPMSMFVCAYACIEIPLLRVFDMDSLMTVLLGRLGLGGLRTVEKVKGITK